MGFRVAIILLVMFACSDACAQTAALYDVLITEIMADPTPAVGLPAVEYLEIRNVSKKVLGLGGWKLSDATSTAVIGGNPTLAPDSALLLCSTGSVVQLAAFARTIGVSSFPSLDNDGDLISLRTANGSLIHAVAYEVSWYGTTPKKDGGWALELVDLHHPCAVERGWKPSTDPRGGTPGLANSVAGAVIDEEEPSLLRTYSTDSMTVFALFNETLDSTKAAVAGNYRLDGEQISGATPLGPLFTSVRIRLSQPLERQRRYRLFVKNLADCTGNDMTSEQDVDVGLSSDPGAADLIINELLFDPLPGGADYVELYNNSNKTIDASMLYIGNRDAGGLPASQCKLSEVPLFIYPGNYLLLSTDLAALERQYFIRDRSALVTISSLPSFPDDEGTVLLTTVAGDIIDELNYTDDMHFALLSDKEGVALERIDPRLPTAQQSNWHSAATAAQYGTPGYRNSQYRNNESLSELTVEPTVFSPDNDGRDDLAGLHYKLPEGGWVGNLTVFDAVGRPVRYIARNALLAVSGSWYWDGLDEKTNMLPQGVYILAGELFNLKGKVTAFKKTVVLARSR